MTKDGLIGQEIIKVEFIKNIPSIKWEGNVHERINGAKMTSILPSEEYMSLYHPKALQRQIKQNELYSKIN